MKGGLNINGFEKCRKRAGLTQTETAEALGVAQGNISMWETGRTYPSAEKLPAIAKLFGCTIDELFGQTKED